MTRRTLALLPLVAAALVLTLVALAPRPASAQTFQLAAKIDGPQALSTCPGGSSGTGFGAITYDDVSNLLSWNITFSGMSGPAISAHFHGPAGPGVDAGITVTISDLTSPSVGSATISASDEAELLSGVWYVNYHSTMCPGGEIRGQVTTLVGGETELAVGAESAPAQQPSAGSGIGAGFLAGMAGVALAASGLVGAGIWFARMRVRS